jgi:succinate dehydrogenase / fumarate reductase flavoprotein subunit/L-aspartate oxidase
MKNDHRLLKVLVEEGPSIAKWLLELGVLFDRDPDGNLHVKKGGGSSKPRLLTCSDYTGLELMRVLKDEVLNQKIQLLEFSAAVELLSDGAGACTGAVLQDLDNKHQVRGRAVGECQRRALRERIGYARRGVLFNHPGM